MSMTPVPPTPESSDKPGAYPPDRFGYADDFGVCRAPTRRRRAGRIASRRLLASRPIVRWAAREGLVLYEAPPAANTP